MSAARRRHFQIALSAGQSVRLHQIDVADTEGLCQFIKRDDGGVPFALLQPADVLRWLKPEISASCSCVKPAFSLILRAFRPTSLRISMRGVQRITVLQL